MMNCETANILSQINTRFYAQNAESFSQTRNAPWDGWRRCMTACGLIPGADESGERSVLDVACGNLRFEAFLAGEYPAIDWRFFAIDNCEPLAQASETSSEEPAQSIAENVNFTCEDIIANMLEDLPLFEPANTSELACAFPFDIVASFGFIHHIPGFELRAEFLKHALDYVKPSGYLVVSFWQFLNDESKRDKIEKTHAEALEFFSTDSELGIDQTVLEPGDYLLGWKNKPGQYRYCHHFTNEEIDALVEQLSPHAQLVDSFTADGKTNNQNHYVVLRRNL